MIRWSLEVHHAQIQDGESRRDNYGVDDVAFEVPFHVNLRESLLQVDLCMAHGLVSGLLAGHSIEKLLELGQELFKMIAELFDSFEEDLALHHDSTEFIGLVVFEFAEIGKPIITDCFEKVFVMHFTLPIPWQLAFFDRLLSPKLLLGWLQGLVPKSVVICHDLFSYDFDHIYAHLVYQRHLVAKIKIILIGVKSRPLLLALLKGNRRFQAVPVNVEVVVLHVFFVALRVSGLRAA